jgi:hypothetical protein
VGTKGSTNLVAAHPENLNAARHGLYSGRVLAERAQEIRSALMTMEHVKPLDVLAVEECASLVSALEAIDAELRARPHGISRVRLLEHKARLGRELRAWLKELGGTPKARAEWAAALGRPTLAEEIRRRLAEAEMANGHE